MPSTDSVPVETIPEPELFGGYFETWLEEQNRDLESLIAAVNSKPEYTRARIEWTRSVSQLVGRVMSHYENYYRVKYESAKQDVLHMLTPSWRSSLEDAYLWVGGWRPSMAFHLLYSISGLQLEAGLGKLTRGLTTGNLADLSPHQLARVDELQRRTIKEEKLLSETLASHQETVADSSMVELSHLATKLITRTESMENRVDSMLERKEDKLVAILCEADDLRLRTLKKVVEILSPIQAAHFLIGASELHLRVHEWGMEKDGHVDGVVGPRPSSP